MSVAAVLSASLRRLLRDRTALFFMLVLPILVILIIGASARSFTAERVALVDQGAGAAGRQLVAELESAPGVTVRTEPSIDAASTVVRRSQADVAVVLPASMSSDLQRGGKASVTLLFEQANNTQQAAATAVEAVLATYGGKVQAAQFATAQAGGSYEGNLQVAGTLQRNLTGIGVRVVLADSSRKILPVGFAYSAPTMLVLFVFLNAMAGGAVIVENRRLGMYERMLSAPIGTGTVIAGEAASFAAIALLQSLLIVTVGAVVFGVSWGDPAAAALLIVEWSLVGAGAGMLAGTIFRTPEQASAIGPAVGIAIGMLGGCMWPLRIVGSTMRWVGHLTPHAWAVDAWTSLLAGGGTLRTIAPQLALIAGFAALFLGLATVRLRHVLRAGR